MGWLWAGLGGGMDGRCWRDVVEVCGGCVMGERWVKGEYEPMVSDDISYVR